MISRRNKTLSDCRISLASHMSNSCLGRIQTWKSFLLIATLLIVSLSILSTNIASGQDAKHHKSLCPANTWIHLGQKCYKITLSPRTGVGAKLRCHELQSSLAQIDDELSKDEEQPNEHSIHSNSSIFSYLASSKKSELQSRLFHVNISAELLKKFYSRLQHENTTMNADSYEHMDVDYPMSDIWVPRDDPVYTSARVNYTENPIEKTPAFVLAKSAALGRWGLVPVSSANKKAAFICERPTSDNDKPQSSRDAPPLGASHQALEPKTSDDILNPQASSISPILHQSEVVHNFRKTTERDNPTTPQPDSSSSALFREFPQNLSTVLGSTAEMRCIPLESDSTLTWTFNGRKLAQSNRVRTYTNGTLRIDHVRNTDGGVYTCAVNSGGLTESRPAHLEILERPHQPEYLSAELLDKLSTSVRIKWTPGFNGNSPITKYIAEMVTVGGDISESEMNSIMQSNSWELAKANISADQTSVIIPDLKPARKYIFRIKAVNKVGTGDPSFPTIKPIEVPVQPPSMPPENLTGTPRSSTSISIQWSPPPPDSQNGVIKGYKIRQKLAGYASDTDWYVYDVSEAAHLSFILEDLITWQNYEIQVAAENDKGSGPYSPSIYVRTKEGRPDKGPRNVNADAESSTVIRVNWLPPPPQHINGINQGYKIQLWLDALQTKLAKEVVAPHNALSPSHSISIDGLVPHTEYYVTIKCFTNAGDGIANEEIVRVKTKQYFPEAVASLDFTEVLDKTLKVLWKPPKRINGDLNHYTLEYSEDSSMDKKILKVFPGGTTETKIFDLKPQTSYTFKIYAHTDFGQGPGRTSNVTTSIPPVLPEPPSNLTILDVGPYSVTIQFNPGFDGNAGIEKWTAEALTPSEGSYKPKWQPIYISTNHSQGNSVIVRNLRPFTRYKIRLTPTNIVGSSNYPSEPTTEFQTSQIEPETAPRDLTLEEVKPTSAVAHWSPLSNNLWLGNPIGYNLTWFETNNSPLMHSFISDPRASTLHVKDLEEFTEYTFRIYAVNEVGQSAPSESVFITTLEDAPSSGPTNLTVHALSSTSISVDWATVPKRHRNGVIKGYKIQYQAVRPETITQHKTFDDNSTKHVVLNDLKPFTTYNLAVAAFTSAGEGVYSPVITVQTLEDTPGIPQNLSSPTVSKTTARILWDPPETPNGEILGYKVSYYPLNEGNKEQISQDLHPNERTFRASNLKPDTQYIFVVTAKTKEGWGQQSSLHLYTYDAELRANLPFFRESWFVISCACLSIVITITVTALLFIQTKSYKYKQDAVKSSSQDRLGDAGFSVDDDAGNHYNNGFGLLPNSANHRRSNGALSQSTANFTLPKTPPRPHPSSVVYSDDDGDDDVFEDVVEKPSRHVAKTPRYDSSGDSLTEKPSEISSSPAPESESADDEYVNMTNSHFVNHYANMNGTLRSQKSWRKAGLPKQYSSHRTKPKLPQRPAPSVPQVPGDHSLSSSDNASSQPMPGTSGMQSNQHHGTSIYGDKTELNGNSSSTSHVQMNGTRPKASNQLSQVNGRSAEDNSFVSFSKQQQTSQQTDLLNNHIVNLNGGRIIVDNMAGSRAPLPGFTSFV